MGKREWEAFDAPLSKYLASFQAYEFDLVFHF